MKRINKNYHTIVGFNATLIGLGVMGLISPTMSAMLHNISTIAISLNSMKNIVEK